MLGFMTKNSKEAFSETWFLSGNSVHFEIYDGGTSLDNSKLPAIKRHTGYIKSTVHGISLNYLCVIYEMFLYKIYVVLSESLIYDKEDGGLRSETVRDIHMQWNWSSIETLNTRNV